MLDIHTHILPGMDDGSESVQESIEILRMLSGQGVDRVVLTSHYYADRESPESFLGRRGSSYGQLIDGLQDAVDAGEIGCDEIPELRLGAEVCYYAGISRTEQLPELCIEDTGLLMLEMPRITWQRHLLEEVDELSCDNRFRLLLAHIDRYTDLNDIDVFRSLAEKGILMQLNADFVADRHNKRLLKKLVRNDLFQFMGSDCHGSSYRAPHMEQAAAAIEKHLGDDGMRMLKYYEKKYF